MQVVEYSTAAWMSFREGEDLRLSWSEIPDCNLCRCRNLGFETCPRKGDDFRDNALSFWSCGNLLDDHIRHDELVRKLTEEGYAIDLAEQDEG